MRSIVCVALLIAVGLAGCSGGDDAPEGPTSAECLEKGLILNATAVGGPACEEAPFEIRAFEDTGHFCVQTKQRDRVHAPDLVGNPWVVGDAWEYALSVDGEDLGTTKLIYYDDQDEDSAGVAQHYMVGTPTRDEALRHALFGENPMIGRVHRILYSPHESGDHADMFHFPLCTGSTWSTVFYGETFTLTATEVDAGPDTRRFDIAGTSPEGSTLRLDYDSATQWFRTIDLARADGSVQMSLEQKSAGNSGEAFFLRGQKDAVIAMDVGLPALPMVDDIAVEREDGNEGPYDSIGLSVELALNGTGAAQVEVIGPDGEQAYVAELGGLQGPAALEELIEIPYQAGTWSIRTAAIGIDPDGPGAARVTGEIRMVSIYDRSGSV